MKKITLIPCVMLLSACSLVPDYFRPDMPVQKDWPAAQVTEANALEQPGGKLMGDLAWKAFFTDVTLQELIQKALENNRDLRVAVLNIEVARATYRVSEAELFPQIDAGGSGTGKRTPSDLSQTIPKQAVTSHQYNANLSVTAFELDLFGRLRSLNQQALENYLATAEARQATQIALIPDRRLCAPGDAGHQAVEI